MFARIRRILQDLLSAHDFHIRGQEAESRSSAVIFSDGTARAGLTAGVKILAPVLREAGFQQQSVREESGSGGPFAWTEFVRHTQRLEVHHRWRLGPVIYWVGTEWLPHREYLLALGVAPDQIRYPGFNTSPAADYADLLADLRDHAGDFLLGRAEWLAAASRARAPARAQEALERQAVAAGDLHTREEARRAFHEGRYAAAHDLFRSVTDPGLLPPSEHAMARMAAERTLSERR